MEALLDILRELHPDVDYEHTEGLIDKKILDSFDIVTLIAEVDDAYGVVIPAEDIIPEHFNSAQALYALIERLLKEDD